MDWISLGKKKIIPGRKRDLLISFVYILKKIEDQKLCDKNKRDFLWHCSFVKQWSHFAEWVEGESGCVGVEFSSMRSIVLKTIIIERIDQDGSLVLFILVV